MKIFYIIGGRSFYKENPPRKIAGVIECWKRLGHEVITIFGGNVLQKKGTPVKFEYGAGSHYRKWYRRVPLIEPVIRSVSEYRDIVHDKEMIKYVGALIAQNRPDLIVERSSRLHRAGLEVAKENGIPFVHEWKDNIANYRFSIFHSRARRVEHVKENQSDYIIVESGVIRDQLSTKAIPKERIIVAHNAVSVKEFKHDERERVRIRNELKISDNQILVGYLGSYAWYHATTLLINAFDYIRQQSVNSIKCLMVGNGREYEKTRQLAIEKGLLDEKIIMLPGIPSSKVPGMLSALDIAVLPGSTDIICPIKIQEFMAAGLPTIAPDYVCNQEVITNNQTGILFKPNEAEALAASILKLAGNPILCKVISKAARREVFNKFTWEKTWGEALEKVFANIKNRKSFK